VSWRYSYSPFPVGCSASGGGVREANGVDLLSVITANVTTNRYRRAMTTDPRAALDRLVAALEAHLLAASRRHGEADPAVVAAYQTLADAFETYDDALYTAFEEVTPFVLYDDAEDLAEEDDEDDEDDDLEDLDDEEEDEEDDDLEDLDDDLEDEEFDLADTSDELTEVEVPAAGRRASTD